MKKIVIIVLALALLLPVIASIQMAQPAAGEVLKSDKERITSPDVSPSEQALLVEGNSIFAFELYKALKGDFCMHFPQLLVLEVLPECCKVDLKACSF